MGDEKDRLGDTLHKKERAEEDRFFAQREKEVIERLRQKMSAADLKDVRSLAHMHCPHCGTKLATADHQGVTLEACPDCQGVWLDKNDLEALGAREPDSWIGRYVRRPRP
jgi:phage FluMu protein Com